MALSFIKEGTARKLYWIILGLGVAILLFFGWRYIRNWSQDAGDPLRAIPPGVLLVAEWNDPSGFVNEKLAGNALWNGLCGDSAWRSSYQLMQAVDSVLERELPLRKRKAGSRTILTIQRTGAGAYQPLLLMVVPKGGGKVLESLASGSGEKLGQGRETQYRISVPGGDNSLIACIRKNILIASFDRDLVSASCAALNEEASATEVPPGFSGWSGQKADFHIWVSFRQVGRFMNARMKPDAFELTKLTSGFATDLELDFLVRGDDITANGFTTIPDSAAQGLSSFASLEAPDIRIQEVLPYNTRGFIHFGAVNLGEWYGKWKDPAYAPLADDPWLSWVSEELAVAELDGAGRQEVRIAVFRVGDHERASASLMTLTARDPGGRPDTVQYRSYTLARTLGHNPFGLRLGRLWEGFVNPWYTIIDDYVIMANERQTITGLINHYLEGNTLAKSEAYEDFSRNISATSNVYVYADLGRMPDLAETWLDTAIAGKSGNVTGKLSEGILGMQWEWTSGNEFFTNLYYRSIDGVMPDRKMTGWQTTLLGNVLAGPYTVFDHRNKERKIITFDDRNVMYLVDGSGTVVWTAQLSDAPMSRVYEVDIYRNGKVQYLFSTRTKVYLIDLNGQLVAGFPWSLPVPASGPLSLFDYENTGEYRLMIPCMDRRIHDFQIDGRPVRGWGLPLTDGLVTGYVRHARLNSKDIIVCTDEDGKVYILNRRGEERIDVRQPMQASHHADFFVDRSKPLHRLLLTDTAGRIAEISQGGDLAFTKLGDYGPTHRYLFADLDGDNAGEHIILDGSKVDVYGKNDRLLRSDSLGFDPDGGMQVAAIDGYGKCIIAHSKSSGRIIILNINGVVRRFDALRGTMPPLVTRLSQDGPQLLVTGESKHLYLYPLE